jgi:hypothetical protein
MLHKEVKRLVVICWALIWLVVVLSLAGCTAPEPGAENSIGAVTQGTLVTITATPLSMSTTVSTVKPTATPTESIPATPLPSPTPTPVIPTPTVTTAPVPTLWPTLPPLPTIAPEQREHVYIGLIQSNGGCELPCWWGFELGKTSVEEVRQFYQTFGASLIEQTGNEGISALYATFVGPEIEAGTQVEHIYLAQDGVIIEVEVSVRIQPGYQIEPILQQLGQPSEIWMWTIPESYQGILPARFRLYFPQRGVFVLYATGGVKVDDHIQVCFDEYGGARLLLWDPVIWDPDGTKTIIDRSNEGGTAFILEGFPVEEVSNWDVEKFYAVLSDPAQSECLETPSNLWSAP